MSTRLTKALREEIAQAIYKASDLPGRLEELEKLPPAAAASIIRSTWPDGFSEALKNVPCGWFGSVSSVYIKSNTGRSGTDERIYLSQESIGRIHASNIRLDDPIPYPVTWRGDASYIALVHEWLYDSYRPMYQVWAADRKKLGESAHALLNSYRTVEALLKAAPEMKQFIPTTSANYPPPALPVSNVIANFLERGVTFQAA